MIVNRLSKNTPRFSFAETLRHPRSQLDALGRRRAVRGYGAGSPEDADETTTYPPCQGV